MSTRIYLVMEHGGEYEDKYDSVLKAWSTQDAAHRHCLDMYFEQARLVYALDKQHEHELEWNKQNPPPVYPNRENYPKWTNLRQDQITEEMRAERNAILARNQARVDAYGEARDVLHGLWRTDCNAYLESIGLSFDILSVLNGDSMLWSRQSDFRIKEIELD